MTARSARGDRAERAGDRAERSSADSGMGVVVNSCRTSIACALRSERTTGAWGAT